MSALIGRAGVVCGGLLLLSGAAFSEVFVADFNGDGKPDVLVSSPAAPDGFVVLINQGEINGKISFTKVMPDVRQTWTTQASATTAASTATASPPLPTLSPTTSPPVLWSTPADETPEESSGGTATPQAAYMPAPAPVKPSIQPPPAPTISTGAPKLKTISGPAAPPEGKPKPMSTYPAQNTPAAAPMNSGPQSMNASPASSAMMPIRREPSNPAAAPTVGIPGGMKRTALFNYKDKTSGSQFAWLERGIANILKFDVLEVKNIQLIDREKTDKTFDPATYQATGPMADLIISGEFEEAGERLVVTTWFLTPNMATVREFRVEGDRNDIFSLIEKVGAKLKQELSAL